MNKVKKLLEVAKTGVSTLFNIQRHLIYTLRDVPIPPSHKGCEEFLKRLTPDIKQRYRADLMVVDKDGIEEVAEKYLSEKNVLNSGKVVIGPKNEKVDVTKRDNELRTVMDA